jgi:outer membrane immunogenic protein
MLFSRNLLIAFGLGSSLLVMGAVRAQAQAGPVATGLRIDVAGTFTAIHANEGPANCGCFYMYGGSGEFSIANNPKIAFVTNVGYTSQTNINNNDRNLGLLTIMEGVRYSRDSERHFVPFAEAFAGISQTNSNYLIDRSTSRIGFMTGAGLDIRLNQRLFVRPAQVDYLFTTVPNGQNNFQNQLRMSAGIVFRASKLER